MHPASGLVSALEPVMRACSGVWVAHGSGDADRETVDDARPRCACRPARSRTWCAASGSRRGGARLLLRLLERGPVAAVPRRARAAGLPRRRLAALPATSTSSSPTRSCEEADTRRSHRAGAGLPLRAGCRALIRERLPRATILTFWHIPWPNAERFGICPWRKELLEGLLGRSILGFHTRSIATTSWRPPTASWRRASTARTSRWSSDGRTTLVRPYPISIEWPHALARAGARRARNAARRCRASSGLPPDALLGVGVDRLDYTKGIEERLLAVERLLERTPSSAGASPSCSSPRRAAR